MLSNTLTYKAHLQVTKKANCCEYGPWCFICHTLFSSQLTSGPNKVECLSLARLSNNVLCNTLTWLICKLQRKRTAVIAVPDFSFLTLDEFGDVVHTADSSPVKITVESNKFPKSPFQVKKFLTISLLLRL